MFPTWRLKLREVRVAAGDGRLEDAAAMLEQESLREFLPARQLAQEVAGKMVARAGERFARGDSAAGWQDLAVADRLGGQGEAIARLRDNYGGQSLVEVRRYLAAGQASAALVRLEKLHRKGLLGANGRLYVQIATHLQDAQRADEHGRFSEAADLLARARGLASEAPTGEDTMDVIRQIDSQHRRVTERAADAQRLSSELYAALADQKWSVVLTAAESLLAIAPKHEAARQARRQAWKAVGMDVTRHADARSPAAPVSLLVNGAANRAARRSTHPAARSEKDDTVSGTLPPNRMLFWIDAVGGFLVCLDDEVVIGQPTPGQPIAVPVLADLSRRHAVIRREGGAYVLEPVQRVSVDGQVLKGPTVLASGQVIQLGESVRMRFTKPHALSATARLDIESHHRTQPSADAVLLMADSCVLGSGSHCHVQSRDWQQDVVLVRRAGGIQCRSAAALTIDGEARSGAIDVEAGERLEGENFSFTWERAET